MSSIHLWYFVFLKRNDLSCRQTIPPYQKNHRKWPKSDSLLSFPFFSVSFPCSFFLNPTTYLVSLCNISMLISLIQNPNRYCFTYIHQKIAKTAGMYASVSMFWCAPSQSYRDPSHIWHNFIGALVFDMIFHISRYIDSRAVHLSCLDALQRWCFAM